MIEEWRTVPGFLGYQVSDLGNARSLDRVIDSAGDESRGPYQRRLSGKSLKPKKDAAGYLGCYPFGRIHNAVMLAFVGICPDGFEVCHNDGNPLNNRRDNLRYDTPSSNQMDKVAHGTSNRGERHGMAKLTREMVLAIRQERGTQKVIAARYGVSARLIGMILKNQRWGWL